METLLTSPYLLLFVRLTLGGIFLLGAIGKWMDPGGSAAALSSRAWVPAPLARLGAGALPLAEALVGVLLLLGLGLQWAALGAVALLAVFTVTVMGDLRRGQALACHCFGRFSRENVSPLTVVRNSILLALAALLAWHPVSYLALDSLFGGATGGLPPAVNAVPVAFLALLAVVAVVLGGTFVTTIRGFLRAF